MKTLALALFAVLVASLSPAQVRDYGFGVFNPYFWNTFITGGIAEQGSQVLFEVPLIDSMVHHPDATRYIFVNTGAVARDSVVSGPGYPIGFNFEFDGEHFNRFGVSANMYIKLGNSSEGPLTMYNDTVAGGVFAHGKNQFRNNVISAFQVSSQFFKGYKLSLKIGWFGFPGERICRVYTNYTKYIGGFPHSVTVYLSLIERDNSINVIYYSAFQPVGTFQPVYCGIRGHSSSLPIDSNVKNLKVADGQNTWLNPALAIATDEWCEYKNGLYPNSVSYNFTPAFRPKVPQCPVGYFKLANPTNPGFVPIVPGYNDNGGYYFASNAINVPTNPTLWWPPGDPRDTLLFDVYLGLDSIGLWPIGEDVSTNSLPLGFLVPNTRYCYKVVAKNSIGSSLSCVGAFVTDENLEYCVSQLRYHSNAVYDSLSLHTLFYKFPTVAGNLDTVSYFPPVAPYTTTLKRDSSYQLSYKKLPGIPNCHTVRVWIDFNQNGSLSDIGETFNGNSTISVPIDAKLGQTRMRVSAVTSCVGVNLGPCPSSNRYQDFTITIAPSTACADFTMGHVPNGPLCHGDSSGSIALNLSGGTPPYAITWEYMGTARPGTGDTLTGLATGTYQAFVTDAAGCRLQTPLIPLVQPYPFVVDTVTLAGKLAAIATGGTSPYLLEWLDSTGAAADSLVPGTYTLVGTDANGCASSLHPVTIPELPDTNPCPLPPCDTLPNPCTAPPCDTVGVDVIQGDGFTLKLYPNPTATVIYLETSRAGSLELYNLLGERVVTVHIDQTNTTYEIDVYKLAAGVYLYRFRAGESARLGRMVIQH